MSTPPAKPPEILDKIVDLVLAHQPKAAAKAAKKRWASPSPSRAKTNDAKGKNENKTRYYDYPRNDFLNTRIANHGICR